MNNVKTMMELARAGARTRPAKMALLGIDTINEAVVKMKKQHRSPTDILPMKRSLIDALKKDISDANSEESGRVETRMSELKESFIKTQRENAPELQAERNAKLLYAQAMSNKEITQATQELIATLDTETDIAYLDSFSAELKSRGMAEHQLFRERLTQADYRQPWLKTAEGVELKRQQKYLKDAPSNGFLIDAETADHRTISTPMNLEVLAHE